MHRAVIPVCSCMQCLGATLKHPTLAHWHIHASSSSIQTNENSYTQTVSLLAGQRISPHPQMLCMMDLRILQAGQRKDSPTPTVTKETCSGAGRRRLWCLTLSTTNNKRSDSYTHISAFKLVLHEPVEGVRVEGNVVEGVGPHGLGHHIHCEHTL